MDITPLSSYLNYPSVIWMSKLVVQCRLAKLWNIRILLHVLCLNLTNIFIAFKSKWNIWFILFCKRCGLMMCLQKNCSEFCFKLFCVYKYCSFEAEKDMDGYMHVTPCHVAIAICYIYRLGLRYVDRCLVAVAYLPLGSQQSCCYIFTLVFHLKLWHVNNMQSKGNQDK